jgi:hypothetical protein
MATKIFVTLPVKNLNNSIGPRKDSQYIFSFLNLVSVLHYNSEFP